MGSHRNQKGKYLHDIRICQRVIHPVPMWKVGRIAIKRCSAKIFERRVATNHQQTVNKQKVKHPTTNTCVLQQRARHPFSRQMISSTPLPCSPTSTRDWYFNFLGPGPPFHIPRPVQITHDVPPPCRGCWTKTLRREICRSRHQPSCSEPIQRKE